MLYNEPHRQRFDEYQTCLARNLDNRWIEEVHLFYDTSADDWRSRFWELYQRPNVRIMPIAGRLTFAQAFYYARTHLRGRSVILANADIYFDNTLRLVTSDVLAGRVVCLSRWDFLPPGVIRLNTNPESHDAWLFRAPIRVPGATFPLGLPGCDPRLVHEIRAAGLVPINPAYSVRAYHLHASGVRHWTEEHHVHGPASHVVATTLAAALPSCAAMRRGRK